MEHAYWTTKVFPSAGKNCFLFDFNCLSVSKFKFIFIKWAITFRCDNGFYGERCTKSICKRYCLNNGSCEVNDGKQATCTCLSGWKGTRCEEKNQTTPDCKSVSIELFHYFFHRIY